MRPLPYGRGSGTGSWQRKWSADLASQLLMNLEGKTILITGGRRVGAQLALELARRGANVALSYFKSRDRIESVAAEVRRLGVRAAAISADLRQPPDVESLVARTVTELGSIDALINMASEFHPQPFDELRASDFDEAMASNLKAPYLAAVAAARAMRRQPI